MRSPPAALDALALALTLACGLLAAGCECGRNRPCEDAAADGADADASEGVYCDPTGCYYCDPSGCSLLVDAGPEGGPG